MTTLCLRGPDVAIVGWIPFFDGIADLPEGHNYQPSVAMHLLFNSGNHAPPDEFRGGYNEFIVWLRSRRDYRGALYIRDVVLSYEENRPEPIISYQVEGVMGYTPPRLILSGIKFAPPGRLSRLKGLSPNDYPEPSTEPLPENRGVSISFHYRFKLSPVMDILQRAITGRWAPNAWGAIDYEIRRDARVRIRTNGTVIPTEDVYIGWKRVHSLRQDMLQNSSRDIQAFLNETPGCADALGRVGQTTIQFARPCDKI